MPKSYEDMTLQERGAEYRRLKQVLKSQEAERPKRPLAISITKNRMHHLISIEKNKK